MSAVPDQREEAARLGEFVREVLVNSSSNIGAREAFDALLSELSRLQAERDELREALAPFLPRPRWLSIGSIDNNVEVRVSRETFERARAALRGSQ